MRMSRFALITAIALLLSGCIKPYTPSIQQGNVITQQQVSKLKLGMSQDDVQYLLGAPILQSPFDANRWDYVYTFQPKDKGPITEKSLTLYFNNQKQLTQIDAHLTK